MDQKKIIMDYLKLNNQATQGELSMALYGDNKHMPNIYSSLMSLIKNGIVNRIGSRPSFYSLSEIDFNTIQKVKKSTKFYRDVTGDLINNSSLDDASLAVLNTNNYGPENNLITECFRKYPHNNDPLVVAMKIGLIDITNSTHLSQHKSIISIVELVDVIISIPNIDERIKNGDPEVVNEIAKSNGKINLFSFASKYCCYHNRNLYEKDDYSIIDTVLKDYLPKYFTDVTKGQIQAWQKNFQYKKYNDFITKKLDELGITTLYRKRKFDHFIWYNNR